MGEGSNMGGISLTHPILTRETYGILTVKHTNKQLPGHYHQSHFTQRELKTREVRPFAEVI